MIILCKIFVKYLAIHKKQRKQNIRTVAVRQKWEFGNEHRERSMPVI